MSFYNWSSTLIRTNSSVTVIRSTQPACTPSSSASSTVPTQRASPTVKQAPARPTQWWARPRTTCRVYTCWQPETSWPRCRTFPRSIWPSRFTRYMESSSLICLMKRKRLSVLKMIRRRSIFVGSRRWRSSRYKILCSLLGTGWSKGRVGQLELMIRVVGHTLFFRWSWSAAAIMKFMLGWVSLTWRVVSEEQTP